MLRKVLVLSAILLFAFQFAPLQASQYENPSEGFSLQVPPDWMELSLPFQNVLVSYGKKGTLATFHITARSIDAGKTVDQLKWEDLFSPQFGSIDIRTQSETELGGEKAKFCVYVLKPGEFKNRMEGKLAAKYINYVLIRRGKLFSITFKDAEEGFSTSYPSFLATVRTLKFSIEPSLPRRPA